MILETNLEDVHPLGVKPAGKNPGKHGKETPVSADGQPMYGQPTFEQALGKYLEEVAKRLVPYVTGSEKPNLPFRLDRAVQKAADVRYAFV
ncbi:hypothetical protein KY362_07395, partial [Candidatus Woesearchaeota archaeon]|nr:hypothetical protein [Candidatus Woesearchaeota archaeon]